MSSLIHRNNKFPKNPDEIFSFTSHFSSCEKKKRKKEIDITSLKSSKTIRNLGRILVPVRIISRTFEFSNQSRVSWRNEIKLKTITNNNPRFFTFRMIKIISLPLFFFYFYEKFYCSHRSDLFHWHLYIRLFFFLLFQKNFYFGFFSERSSTKLIFLQTHPRFAGSSGYLSLTLESPGKWLRHYY